YCNASANPFSSTAPADEILTRQRNASDSLSQRDSREKETMMSTQAQVETADSGAAMSGLTDQIRHSVNNPLTSTDFDFTAALDDVLSTVDLSATDAGGKVRFYGGADPLIASPFQFAAAA